MREQQSTALSKTFKEFEDCCEACQRADVVFLWNTDDGELKWGLHARKTFRLNAMYAGDAYIGSNLVTARSGKGFLISMLGKC